METIRDHREAVLAALPYEVVGLLKDIEEFSGTRVGFRDMEILRMAGGQHTDVEALYADHRHAYISIPDPSAVNANAVLHELLHLRRYWVEAAPILDAKVDRGPNVELAASFDNLLEHMIIVPRERDYGFDPGPYWTTVSTEHWREHPWPTYSPEARRMHALCGWLTTKLSDDHSHHEEIIQKLGTMGLLGEAQRLEKRLRMLLTSKPQMVSALSRFLKIPRQQFSLDILDVRNRRKLPVPIPDH